MTASSINPIHLYRNLLREASYLIDTNSQTHIRALITSSFRKQIPTPARKHQKQGTEQNISVHSLDTRSQLKKGRKFLSLLQRANQGYIRPLSNVLKITYARKGRRRRELMQEYMSREAVEDGKVMGTSAFTVKLLNGKAVVPKQDWKPSYKFMMLMRSQHMIQNHLDRRTPLRLGPVISALNRARRPMPACRIKNMTMSWYAKTAQLLLPHLKSDEYEDMRTKATGQSLVVNRRRRKLATIGVFNTQSLSNQEDALSNTCGELIQGPKKRISTRQRKEIGNPHHMTRRFLGRMYTRVLLRQTPLAITSPNNSKVAFSWEDGLRRLPRIVQPSSEEQVKALFDP